MNTNHYTFIQHVCDADYRAVDQENPFLEQYTVDYFIQLHENMLRREIENTMKVEFV
jgi:hypothetical protein